MWEIKCKRLSVVLSKLLNCIYGPGACLLDSWGAFNLHQNIMIRFSECKRCNTFQSRQSIALCEVRGSEY
jgi:hypothetical protein